MIPPVYVPPVANAISDTLATCVVVVLEVHPVGVDGAAVTPGLIKAMFRAVLPGCAVRIDGHRIGTFDPPSNPVVPSCQPVVALPKGLEPMVPEYCRTCAMNESLPALAVNVGAVSLPVT
jgi:hypothetical protein